jgi:hypothetical protein
MRRIAVKVKLALADRDCWKVPGGIPKKKPPQGRKRYCWVSRKL